MAAATSSTSRSEGPIRMSLRKRKLKNKYCASPLHSSSDDIHGLDDDSVYDSNFSANETDVETEAEMEKKKKGKKRKQKPETWTVTKAKVLRNSGKPYVSSSKTRKEFPARKLRPPCRENCRLRCREKINDEVRQEIFRHYWSIADLQKQRDFIAAHTQPIIPKYRYPTTQGHRNLNSAFYFEVKSRIRVCKTFFKATLGINDRPIRTVFEKKNERGFVEADRRGKHGKHPTVRGKHGKHPTVDPEITDSVRRFIDAIPRIESHYLRAQTTREFIEGGKSLAGLYRDYKESRKKQDLLYANSTMFNRIFNGNNISFYVPGKNQCDLCESFKNANEESKEGLIESYRRHLEEEELSSKEKDDDKNKPNVAVFDLQAVMHLPKGLDSSFYYKSKINCYNFTVSDLYAENSECFFWTEIDGKCGAVEIGSCVLRYIELLIGKTNDPDITFYSDSCLWQQKNTYLLAIYLYALHKHNIRSITHKFLIHGHMQNEGDNIHGVIEKQVQRHLKSSPIYIPEQYVTLIILAKQTDAPYRIHQLSYEDFYDVKRLQKEWRTNFSVRTEKKLKWDDIKVFKVEKEKPEEFFYKTSYKDTEFEVASVWNKKIRSPNIWKSVRLTKAYSKRFPLPENKKKDIQDLIEKNLIPKNYYDSFYKDVLSVL